MDPKRRRVVWIVVAAIGLGLIADGILSSISLARFGSGPMDLARGQDTVPVWTNSAPAPEGHATRRPGTDLPFLVVEDFVLPNGQTVTCRFLGGFDFCEGDWSVAIPE